MMGSATQFPAAAVLFDLDDTLYDRRATFATWASAFVRSHPRLQDSSQQEAIEFLIALDGYGRTPRTELFTAFQQRYPNLYEVEAIIETYYRQFPDYIEHDHLLPLLDVLQRGHLPFGIVTNGYARQQLPKLDVLGLAPLTSCVFISEVFGASKPDASIFLAAAACLGVPAHQVLFIGDNPLVDMYGAHQVGMKTAWVRNGFSWPEGVPFCVDMIIDSLVELPSWIAATARAGQGRTTW